MMLRVSPGTSNGENRHRLKNEVRDLAGAHFKVHYNAHFSKNSVRNGTEHIKCASKRT